jgi:hypothetical protein
MGQLCHEPGIGFLGFRRAELAQPVFPAVEPDAGLSGWLVEAIGRGTIGETRHDANPPLPQNG